MGVWGKMSNVHDEWILTTDFRVSGGERAGGTLHLWYTSRGSKSGSGTGQDTIYTSPPWDGLALVVDTHTGAPQVRGYLNDGRTDYSKHHNPTSLAFGHCDFDYRNKGSLSQIKVTQNTNLFKVEVDGKMCFQTDKIRLPKGYFFGLTAATSQIPDSFELFNFLVGAPHGGYEVPKDQHQQQYQQQGKPQQQQGKPQQQQQQQQQPQSGKGSKKAPHEQVFEEWLSEPGEEDHEAMYYKSAEEQFTNLHNRLQGLTHHLAAIQTQLGMIYDTIDTLHHKEDQWRDESRGSNVPREQINKLEARLEVIENISMQIAQAMTSKDYTQHFEELRNTLKEHHMNLLYSVPDSVTQVLATGGPKIGMMVTIVVLVQVGLAVAYVIYKKRRNSSPKKYL